MTKHFDTNQLLPLLKLMINRSQHVNKECMQPGTKRRKYFPKLVFLSFLSLSTSILYLPSIHQYCIYYSLITVTLSNGIYQFVREGSMAVLVCPYKPVYTWSDGHTMVIYTLHNEINYALTVSNRLAVSKETNLIIRNVTTEDAGIYRCTKLSSDVPVWHDIILGIRRKDIKAHFQKGYFRKNNKQLTE